jgi:hypothetical protein
VPSFRAVCDRAESARQAPLRFCLQIPCKFPVTGNLTGNFALFTLFGARTVEFNQQFQAATAKFPTQGNREFFPPEQGIFRLNRELTGNLRKHRRQLRKGAQKLSLPAGQFDRNQR